MFKLDENYYLRKCFFKREQVPTQSAMKRKMGEALANVYFKSMTYKLKVLAGLEPPLKGGGADWFIPPVELLKGRAVMEPMEKKYLSKLGSDGIGYFGHIFVANHKQRMEDEINNALLKSDEKWKFLVEQECKKLSSEIASESAKENTKKIRQAYVEFHNLYATSFNKLEAIMLDATMKQITEKREATRSEMMEKYETLVKKQANMLYDRYTERLDKKKAELKADFIENVETARTSLTHTVHDINVDKHVAIEKLRKLLECQNLACQIYVALKEREECEKELEQSKHEHKKKTKLLNEEINLKKFEIELEIEKDKKRKQFNKIWQTKVCHIVKKFQMFVSFCLNTLPEHAEFFLNMEKLMMLQLNEVLDNPKAESVIETEEDGFKTPVPRSKPFVVFADLGQKHQFDEKLCPKKVSMTPSHHPVIIINKRCIYSACDNMQQFLDKMKSFLHGKRGEDADFVDDHDYQYDVPVSYGPSQQLQELKLEDSLMQVLQNEMTNLHRVPTACCACKLPYCFCSPLHASAMNLSPVKQKPKEPSLPSIPSVKQIETRSIELMHEREPKWESYMEYVKSKKCHCAKTAKKHLMEHLPPYMRNMSKYTSPEIPNYEPCDLTTLKKLVKKARGKPIPPPTPPKVESKTRDMGVQYSDTAYDYLCTCFSDDEITKLYDDLAKPTSFETTDKKFSVVRGLITPSELDKQQSSFATDRAFSLRQLLDEDKELQELFKTTKCDSTSDLTNLRSRQNIQ